MSPTINAANLAGSPAFFLLSRRAPGAPNARQNRFPGAKGAPTAAARLLHHLREKRLFVTVRRRLLLLLLLALLPLLVLLLLFEPAIANKFETIGSGVAGSYRLKAEFMRGALLTGGSFFVFAAILAVVVPHSNAAYLNFANWKASAVVLALIGAGLFTAYFFI
jgi:hypothetical protein